MSELFASIKAFIEKGNIIIFLLAVAVAIFTYQVFAKEILWAVFAFCLSYAVFYGIQNLYNNYKANIKQIENNRKIQEAENIRRQQEETQKLQQHEQANARLRMIYDSLPDDVKDGLIKWYKLPQTDGGYLNSRVLYDADIETNQPIINAYNQIRFTIGLGREDLIEIQPSVKSQIVTLVPEFYHIVEEKAKEKGVNNG